ncbi:MAG: hypothetical protein H7Y15_04535 [Pseudonocardia sp.]|nr:hypothetical protein [Pseudonocardia sp.]
MYTRVNMIFGRPDMVEDGIAQLEESDRRAVEATDGNRGLTTLVDRGAGVIVAVSYWDESARASAATLTRARADAVAAAGGDIVVETFEVAAQETLSVPTVGAVVRMVRVQIATGMVAEALGFIHDEVLRRLRVEAGFRRAELMIDRATGGGLLLVAWTAEEAAKHTDTLLDRVRDEASGRVGTTFPRTETYAVVGIT